MLILHFRAVIVESFGPTVLADFAFCRNPNRLIFTSVNFIERLLLDILTFEKDLRYLQNNFCPCTGSHFLQFITLLQLHQ